MDGSNHAAAAFGIDDLDALKAVLSSVPPEMAAQAESHGVIVPTIAAYVQAQDGTWRERGSGGSRLQQPGAATTAAVPGQLSAPARAAPGHAGLGRERDLHRAKPLASPGGCHARR